jgi:hypothetical protein
MSFINEVIFMTVILSTLYTNCLGIADNQILLTVPRYCTTASNCVTVNDCPEYQDSYSDYVYCNVVSATGMYIYGLPNPLGPLSTTATDRPLNTCSLRNHYEYPSAGIVCDPVMGCPRKGRLCYNQIACTKCSPGYFVETTNCICKNCPAGSLCTDSAITGTCPAGTYSQASQSSCTECSTGAYSGAQQSSCTDCAAGTYNNRTGQTACTGCPVGKYNGIGGQSACLNCPNGKFSTVVGATMCSDCSSVSCATNQYFLSLCSTTTDSVCSACPANYYCNGVNATVCTAACAPGTYEVVACSPTTNRVCKACDLCTLTGQYKMNCGGTSAGTCANCTNT